jgi:L-fuconolactonase
VRITVDSHKFRAVLHLIERFPALRIVIDLLGKPPISTREMSRWEVELRAAAAHPNMMSKISRLNTSLNRVDWSVAGLRPSVDAASANGGKR